MATSVAFLSIAFRNVVRNRQKTVTSVLGIILAVTLIFGETISIEHQSGAVLQHEMEDQNVHFSIYSWNDAQASVSDFRPVIHELMNVTGIETYSININMNLGYTKEGDERQVWYNSNNIVIHLPELNTTNTSYHMMRGSFGSSLVKDIPSAPARGSILLSSRLRILYDLERGDQLELTFSDVTIEYNETGKQVNITQQFLTRNFTVAGFWDQYNYGWDEPWFDPWSSEPSTIRFHGDDYLDLHEAIMDDLGPTARVNTNFQYYSTLHPDSYQRTSLIRAEKNAEKVENELRSVIDNARTTNGIGGIDLYPSYKDAFESTETYFADVKWLLVALSVPIILFGLYLGYLGIDLFLSERRREIGMLKARGATNRQLMVLLTTESLFVGAFAGAAGIILGGFGSRLILLFTQADPYVDLAWYDLGFSFGAFISAIFLGMILMLGSAAHLFRRITRLEAGELLSKYSSKQEKPYNASRDLKILAFAVICLVAIAFIDPLDDLANNVDNILLSLVLGLFVFMVVPIMVLSSPYIVIVIGIRLATRGQKAIFLRLAEIAERFTGELGYLIRRGIATGNRRIVNLTTVLSVLFAFLVLVSTFTFAQQDLEERIIRTEIGSDIRVTFDSRLTVNDSIDLQENLSAIDGIETILPVFKTEAEVNIGQFVKTFTDRDRKDNQHVTIFILDCTSFSNIASLDDRLFKEGAKKDVASLDSGGVIISSRLSDRRHLGRGDDLLLVDPVWNWSSDGPSTATTTRFGEQEVRGVMFTLPGLYHSSMMNSEDYWVLMHDQVYAELIEGLEEGERRTWESEHSLSSRITLIDTSSDVDPEELETFIDEIGSFDVDGVRSSILEIETMLTEPTSDSSVLILRTELGVLIFISLFASATIVFISSFEKIRERAAIMLRGTTSRQLYALEFGEASVILVYSLVVGILTGYLAGVVWIYVFNVFQDLDVIQRSYAPSFTMFPIIGLMVVIFLTAVAISTIRLRKFDLIKFVRWG